MTDEEKREKRREYNRKYRAANKIQLKKKRQAYRAAHLSKLRERELAYYHANRGRMGEYARAWREANRAKIRAYEADNRDEINARQRSWRARNPCRVRAYTRKGAERGYFRGIMQKHGVAAEEYGKMVAAQKGCCAICGSKDEGNKKARHLCVDHCHATGKVRGLLCALCNRMLGFAKENPDVLAAAILYLGKHNKCGC